jgi:hypothetical protein
MSSRRVPCIRPKKGCTIHRLNPPPLSKANTDHRIAKFLPNARNL